MKRNIILAVTICLAAVSAAYAAGQENKHQDQRYSQEQEFKTYRSKAGRLEVSPYASCLYTLPGVGVSATWIDNGYGLRLDGGSAMDVISKERTFAYNGSASLVAYNENENLYGGVGGGVMYADFPLHVMGSSTRANVLFPMIPVFVGYKGNMAFAELGAENLISSEFDYRVMPIPKVKLGLSF